MSDSEKNNVDYSEESKESLIELISKLEDRIGKLEDRIEELEDKHDELEDSADMISDELIHLLTALMKVPQFREVAGDNLDVNALLGGEHIHEVGCDCDECSDEHDDCDDDCCDGDDDENENNFIRCPYCNTLIFLSDENKRSIVCPFCGEKFSKQDVM